MDIDDIRRENLKSLESRMGPQLYKAVGMSPTQFYNLRDGAKDSRTGKQRGMRKETARRFERAAGMPAGWLDAPHQRAIDSVQDVQATYRVLHRPVPEWPFSQVSQEQWGSLDQSDRDKLEAQVLAVIEYTESAKKAA